MYLKFFKHLLHFKKKSKWPQFKDSIILCITRRRRWHPTPVLLPGKSNGRRGLVGCSPWGREESDTTKQLHFHFSLSCIGEGNGNPLQCSCLENPRDWGAWWAAICGVAQSRTRLKQLSSSSSRRKMPDLMLFYHVQFYIFFYFLKKLHLTYLDLNCYDMLFLCII